ncbi:MAG: cation-translocating P-type ATPase, partial [Christensenellaceae bacterium]
MKHYLHSAKEVLFEVASGQNGLSADEAASRLAKDGENKLKEGKKKSIFVRFLEQIANPMILILLAAAAIDFVTVLIDRSHGGTDSFADCIIILVVVLLNAVMGVVQESKAEEAIAALQEMTAATCQVIRDGVQTTVKSSELVVGDIVVLAAGDSVPADCRLIEAESLKVEEAALTGESVPVEKNTHALSGEAALGDRKNMAYMGTTVVYGRGKAVVVATGMNTEMGKIADVLAAAEDEETPLQKKLSSLSKILSFLVLGICVFIFIFKLAVAGSFALEVVLDSFIIAISLAVAAIPEGLATVVTIVLSMGVTKMAKKNAVIRKLTAVETLGCTQIICSDKTGTLTQNKMTVVEYYGDDKMLLAKGMAQCSDSVLDARKRAKGEPTENALVDYAWSLGVDKNALAKREHRI